MNLLGLVLFAAVITAGTSTKVTAQKAFRHSAESCTYLSGNVHIDEKTFSISADRAYVYFGDGDAEVNRIVAFGSVAITSLAHTARAETAHFLRAVEAIDLIGSPTNPAIVTDSSGTVLQSIKAQRIRLYTKTGRAEVLGTSGQSRRTQQSSLAWNIHKSKR
ncbi:MAG: hypothetical protein J6R80_01540 [Kiritimatiellae bacterium]|nr:hypothetical protein [Kiritimatiellia bacterium]